jgi:crotonobetainyl-CoA:carnitine CoA-transferase CaiB-like acyl-CoA transferase
VPDPPLAGLRVVELSQIIAAPYCGQMLGDLGAEVIKVELPGSGDVSRSYGPHAFGDLSYYFCAFNRNKESVTLDLRKPAAAAAMQALLARADVFLHNSLAASIERLGLDYESVRALNPRLVYCAISGYGRAGPEKDTAALDLVAQAAAGVMYLTGEPSGPPQKAGVPVADLAAAMFAAYAILAALRQRDQTGLGQLVDTSLFESAAALTTYLGSQYLATGANPPRLGNAHPSIVPYDCYRCADGYVVVAGANQSIWERFCHALWLNGLLADPRFRSGADRATNRAALDAVITDRLADEQAAAIVRRLRVAGVPAEVVKDLGQLFGDPQAEALGLVRRLQREDGEIPVIAPPYHLSASDELALRPPPRLGEHTEKWLRAIGLDAAAIARLREDGAI